MSIGLVLQAKSGALRIDALDERLGRRLLNEAVVVVGSLLRGHLCRRGVALLLRVRLVLTTAVSASFERVIASRLANVLTVIGVTTTDPETAGVLVAVAGGACCL